MLTFHDPIPDIRGHVCNALLVMEYWYRGELAEEASVVFMHLNADSWHRFHIDAGQVFWKTVEAPDPPMDAGDYSYRIRDVGLSHKLNGKRLAAVDAIDVPDGGCIRLGFEGGAVLTLENRNDRSRVIFERDDPLQRLAEETGVELVRRGGETYVRVEDAPRLLGKALDQGIGVLGVEGFNVDGQFLIPDIGTIVSFEKVAGPEAARNRTEAAIALVKELASEVSLVCISFD